MPNGAPQVPPLRLFLVVILVFFFAGSLRRTIWHSDTGVRGFAASASLPRLSPKGHPNDPPVARWLRPRLMDALAHRREFAVAFDIRLYRIAIVFLPISTLLLSLLFFFGRRFFIFDHAIFSMHSLAFMGLLFTLITL